jgi:hypothetical protein
MSGWLKAGLIGAVIVIALKVLELVPCVACCALPLEWVALGCMGALAARWIVPPRSLGAGAGQGALAGLTAAVIGGVVGIGINVVGATALAPLRVAMLRQLPPEVLQAMAQSGFDPSMLTGAATGVVETITGGAVCCGIGLVIGAALGALGGLIFSGIKSE